MELHNLKPAEGSVHREKRIGRGQGSGHGGTSTRGHKGAKSRSGYSKKVGFEGGQMPIHRRLPKFGFTNINRKEFKGINIGTLQMVADKLKTDKIGVDTLISVGLARKDDKVKILGNGTLTTKLEVSAHAFSESAVKAIQAQNGTVVKL